MQQALKFEGSEIWNLEKCLLTNPPQILGPPLPPWRNNPNEVSLPYYRGFKVTLRQTAFFYRTTMWNLDIRYMIFILFLQLLQEKENIRSHCQLRCRKHGAWSAETPIIKSNSAAFFYSECLGIERDSVGSSVDLHPSRTICRVPALEVLFHTAFVLPGLRWKRQAFQAPSNINHLLPLCIVHSTV